MSTTTSYFIKPEDGWVQISSGAIGLLRVTAVPHTHPFYIANGASAPTSVDTGIQVCHKPFWFNVNDATNWWVKVVNPVQNSRRNDSSLRVDVVALNASSGGGGGTSTAYAEANVTYTAVTGGTGYSINDTIVHIVTADPTGVSGVTGNFWVNLTTGAQLASAPTLANLTLLAPAVTVAGVATAANQVTQTTALNQLHTDLIAALPAGSNTIGNVGAAALRRNQAPE